MAEAQLNFWHSQRLCATKLNPNQNEIAYFTCNCIDAQCRVLHSAVYGILGDTGGYCYRWFYSVVCPSVTLMHSAKAATRNVMSFGNLVRTLTWPQVTLCIWQGSPFPYGKKEKWGRNPSQKLHFKLRSNRRWAYDDMPLSTKWLGLLFQLTAARVQH